MVLSDIRIAFGDTDPYGVVFFASYFKYFHRGIEDFFLSRDIEPGDVFKNSDLKFGLPVVQSSCRFLSPARYGDTITLETRLKSLKSRILVFSFAARKKGQDTLIAEGEITLVGINQEWEASPVPEKLLMLLKD